MASAGYIDGIVMIRSSDNASCYAEYHKMMECIRPHESLIESTIPTLSPDSLYNIDLIHKALDIGKNISECLGHDSKCEVPRIVAFVLDYGKYIGGKVYGDAYQCFEKTKTVGTFSTCLPKLADPYEEERKQLRDPALFTNATSTAIECVAKKLFQFPECTVARIVDLYQAAKAMSDAYYQYFRWAKQAPTDWTFNEKKYCDM